MDECVLFRRRAWGRLRHVSELVGFLRALRAQRWDLVVDFQGLFRSGLCTWCASRHGDSWGFADARELAPRFYRHRVAVPGSVVHAVERNLALLNAALGTAEPYAAPRFKPDPAADAQVAELLAPLPPAVPLVTLAPASRWPSKTWPPDFFAALIAAVAAARPAVAFALLGAADEAAVGAAVRARLAPGLPVVDLMGRTELPTLLALLRRSRVAVTNDSGPLHLAAALDVPVVAFFGPTSPERTGPYGPQHRVFRSAAACAPCFARVCPRPPPRCWADAASAAAAAAAVVERLG